MPSDLRMDSDGKPARASTPEKIFGAAYSRPTVTTGIPKAAQGNAKERTQLSSRSQENRLNKKIEKIPPPW